MLGLSASYSGLAMGIHQSELAVNCTGTVQITGVKSQSIHGPFYDRAGNYHPASGYANFTVEVTHLDAICEDVKEELGLDLENTKFATSKSYKVGTLELLHPLTAAEVGKSYKFKTKQHFGFAEKDGSLPFYPLLSQQSLTLESDISIAPSLTVKPAKDYLLEEEKVELTEAIFAKLKTTEYEETALNSQILYALQKHYPQFQSNLKPFVKQYLEIFSIYENKAPKDELFDFHLSTIANGVSEISSKYPAYYEFKFAELLPKHPSLLNLYKLPKITAIELETAMQTLEDDFKNGLVGAKVKKNFHEVLKKMAGHYGVEGELVQLTSQKSKDIAKQLLSTHYSN